MKTLRVSYGLPRLRCGFSFHFWESIKRLSRTRVHEGRVAPHQRERSDRAWTMGVRVALAGAAAGRLDGLTVHRSPCRCWECGYATRLWPCVSDDLVSLGCVVETDCGRPPPIEPTALNGKPSTVPWVFRVDLHSLPELSRVLASPCVTSRRGISPFTRDFIC